MISTTMDLGSVVRAGGKRLLQHRWGFRYNPALVLPNPPAPPNEIVRRVEEPKNELLGEIDLGAVVQQDRVLGSDIDKRLTITK